jgi:hypothetical protein
MTAPPGPPSAGFSLEEKEIPRSHCRSLVLQYSSAMLKPIPQLYQKRFATLVVVGGAALTAWWLKAQSTNQVRVPVFVASSATHLETVAKTWSREVGASA